MPPPCRHDPPLPEICRLCYLQVHDVRYQNLWKATASVPIPEPPHRSLPCIFLGTVRDRLDCTCPGRWLRGCSLHETTTLQICKICTDYVSE